MNIVQIFPFWTHFVLSFRFNTFKLAKLYIYFLWGQLECGKLNEESSTYNNFYYIIEQLLVLDIFRFSKSSAEVYKL